MEESITLDRKAFKALSSESRVAILKSLARRRKMLAELSQEFGMSPAAMKEHMDSLLGAGLVDKKDDGHKWKYYELTRAGRRVTTPGETRFLVLIGISAVALLLTSYGFIGGFDSISALYSIGSAGQAPPAATGEAGAQKMLPGAEQAAPAYAPTAPAPASMGAGPYAAGFIAFSLILGMSIGFVAGRRRSLDG